MNVKFDRILDPFDGPFVALTDFAKVPAGSIGGGQPSSGNFAAAPVGYYFSHQVNDSFTVINRLLAANEEVSWLWNGPMGYGTFYVAAKPTTLAILQKATELGVSFQATTTAPTGLAAKLRKPRIALFDTYGGGMPSGWTRLVFENFEFPYEVVYPPDLDKGGLRAKYDVIVFNGAGAPGGGGRGGGGAGAGEAPGAASGQGAAVGPVNAAAVGLARVAPLARRRLRRQVKAARVPADAARVARQAPLELVRHLLRRDRAAAADRAVGAATSRRSRFPRSSRGARAT